MANPKNLFVKMYDPSPQRHKLRIILTHLVACTAGINGGVKEEVLTLSLFLCFMPAFKAKVLDAIFYVTRLKSLCNAKKNTLLSLERRITFSF